ncbi:MAG: hypothetical protein CFE21_07600 [Bacteroidetes bacterium B1(2017)]|nr:MAG: hypothetical protein CFE21_07600 [Bacteroidetes bacterium B1(2017)]
MNNIAEVVLRSISVYLFMIIAMRLMGKKELSQLNTSDLILILLISNSVQNAMVGTDTSLQGGIIAATSLFIVNYALKLLVYKNRNLQILLEGEPTLLIYKGEIQTANLDREKITLSELKEAIREHGLSEFSDVGLSMLERDGNISVVAGNMDQQHIYKRKRGLSLKLSRKK